MSLTISPDGTRVMFGSTRTLPAQIYAMPSNRSSPPEQLWKSVDHILPADWSPDGDVILNQTVSATGSTGHDLWAQTLGADGVIAVANTPIHETRGQFSPDGRWVAYQSDESGRSEVHIKAFPGPGSRQQVSSEGGGQPRWSADGRELFYVSLDSSLMVIELEPTQDGRSLQTSPPQMLFRTRITGSGTLSLGFKHMYDVALDSQRFLMAVVPEQATTSPITVLLNWRSGSSE